MTQVVLHPSFFLSPLVKPFSRNIYIQFQTFVTINGAEQGLVYQDHTSVSDEFFYAPCFGAWRTEHRGTSTHRFVRTHVSHMPKKRPESECGHSGRILSGARGVLGADFKVEGSGFKAGSQAGSQLPATASFSPPEISVPVIRAYVYFFKVLNF